MCLRALCLRLCRLVLLTGLVSLIAVPRVSAHALLVRSVPAAGDRLTRPPVAVDLWFSEPLDRSFSRVEVRDQSGQRVDEGVMEFSWTDETQISVRLKPLKPGVYIVSWRTLSKGDGHPWNGSFSYIVLNPDGSVPEGPATFREAQTEVPSLVASPVRWLELVSGTLLVGGLAFLLLVTLPALRILPASEIATASARLRRQALLWVSITALAFILASSLGLLLQAQDVGGLNLLPGLILRSRPGHLWLLRLALTTGVLLLVSLVWAGQELRLERLLVGGLLALIMVFLLVVSGYGWVVVALVLTALGLTAYLGRRSHPFQALLAGPQLFWVALVFAGFALLTVSLTSHAAALPQGTFWTTLADYLHLLAAAAWTGGLVSLAFLWRTTRAIEGFDRTRFLAQAAARFSPLAALCVVLIVASGSFSGLVQVPSVAALAETAYGRALIAKLALVGLLLSVGGLNAFVVRPRLARWAGVAAESEGVATSTLAEVWQRRLLLTVALEAALGVLVLASVGILTQIPPSRTSLAARAGPPQAAGQGMFAQTVLVDDLEVVLTITPNRAGVNQFVVRVRGTDPQEILRVRLTFLSPGQDVGRSWGLAAPIGEGIWSLEGPYLPFGGSWQVLVGLRRVEKDDVVLAYQVQVAGPLPLKPKPARAFAAPEMGIDFMLLIGLYLTAIGAGLLWWRQSQRGLGWFAHPSLVLSTLVIVGGLLLVFGGLMRGQPAAGSVDSLEPATALPETTDLTLGGDAGEVLVGLTLRPGEPGRNRVLVYLLPQEGEAAAAGIGAELVVGGRVIPLEVCGPTCRWTDLDLQGGEQLKVQVAGPKGGTVVFDLPPLPAPDGSALLERLQERMRNLRTCRVEEVLGPVRPPIHTWYTYQAPDRMHVDVSTGSQTVWIGGTRYLRTRPETPWRAEETGFSPQVPLFVWDSAPFIAPRIVGKASVDGIDTHVLVFFQQKGQTPIWFRLWVDPEGLVRRAEMRAQAHFMSHRYYDFDAPFMIEPPAD